MIPKVPTPGADFGKNNGQSPSSTANLPSDFFQILMLVMMNLFQEKGEGETANWGLSVNPAEKGLVGSQSTLKEKDLNPEDPLALILGSMVEYISQNLNPEAGESFPSRGKGPGLFPVFGKTFPEDLRLPIEFPEKLSLDPEAKAELQKLYARLVEGKLPTEKNTKTLDPLPASPSKGEGINPLPTSPYEGEEKIPPFIRGERGVPTPSYEEGKEGAPKQVVGRLPEALHHSRSEKNINTRPGTHFPETDSQAFLKFQETPRENARQVYALRHGISLEAKTATKIKDPEDPTRLHLLHAEGPHTLHGGKNLLASSREIFHQASQVQAPQESLPPGEVIPFIKDMVYQIQPSGERRARIKLEPPDLGEMEIDLKVHKGEVRLILTVEKPEAARELHLHLPHLSHSLTEMGLKLSDFQITFFGGGGGEGSYTYQDTEGERKREPVKVEEIGPSKEGPALDTEKEGLLNIIV